MSEPWLFQLVAWNRCPIEDANDLLTAWGHYLGPCHRPFAQQAFVLTLLAEPVAVAVSASLLPAGVCGYGRQEVVELARLCCHPDHRDLTRVALRLWRKTAPDEWRRLWPVLALLSYAQSNRHDGSIYRFDGWVKGRDSRASNGSSNYGRGPTRIEAKLCGSTSWGRPGWRGGHVQVRSA